VIAALKRADLPMLKWLHTIVDPALIKEKAKLGNQADARPDFVGSIKVLAWMQVRLFFSPLFEAMYCSYLTTQVSANPAQVLCSALEAPVACSTRAVLLKAFSTLPICFNDCLCRAQS
jgi:hypothetical protein